MLSVRGVNVLLAALIGAAWSLGPGPTSGSTDSHVFEIPAQNVDKCEQTACRDRRFMRIELGDGHKAVPLTVGRMPFVGAGGVIALVPGDSLVFHLARDGGLPVFVRQDSIGDPPPAANQDDPNSPAQSPVAFKVPGSAEQRLAHEPPGTLIVSFTQVPGGPAMVLQIAHNLEQPLQIEASIMGISRAGFDPERTSICPVLPEVLQAQTWPHAIASVMLETITLLPKDATTAACR